jgi:hypothetical protein
MTASGKHGPILLLAIGAIGIVAAGGVIVLKAQAQSGANPQITQTALYQTDSVLGRDLIASGKNAGRIVDVLADKYGHVQAVVIDCGGFLGIGGRKIAVAWSDLRFDPDTPSSVSTDLPEERLSAAPEVKSGKPVVVVTARNQARNKAQNGMDQN